MESNIRTVGLLLTLLLAVYALRKGRDLPALVFIALSPFSYFSQDLGFVLTPAKLLGLLFLGYVFVNPTFFSGLNNKYFKTFGAYYFYTFYLTVVMTFTWPDNGAASQSFLYSASMRGFVQIFQAFMGISIILVLLKSVNSVSTLFRVQVVMLASMLFISIYGLYVWVAQRTGLPFNPISRLGGKFSELSKVISTKVNGENFVRAYSLTGEPKSLAVNACFGIVLVYFTPAIRSRFFRRIRSEKFLIPFFLVMLYLTLSTAGFIILPLVMIVGAVIQFRIGQLSREFLFRFGVFAVLGIPILLLMDIDIVGKVSSIFELRVQSRLESDGMFTYADAAMISLWGDSPLYALTGVGLGGSTFYVRIYDADSYAGLVAAPRGMVGFISDKGLIGLAFFSYAILKAIRPLVLIAASNSPNRKVYAGILIICVVNIVLVFTYALWGIEWTTIGLLCASATLAEREIRMRKAASFQRMVYA